MTAMDYYDLLHKEFLFYGVDNQMMKLDNLVYEVLEDPSDGYRSLLGEIELRKAHTGVFFRDPLAIVSLHIDNTGVRDGYKLVEETHGLVEEIEEHVWLEFGTDNSDDYYPSFYFNYTPKPPPKITKPKIHNTDIDPFDRLFEPRDI